MPSQRRALLPIAGWILLIIPPAASPQTPAITPSQRIRVNIESGDLGNPGDTHVSVFTRIVSAQNAPGWIRLHFDNVQLEGDSYLQIRSLADGDTQTLDAQAMVGWSNSTAYFNGWEVMVQLFAGPGTQRNHFRISEIESSTTNSTASASRIPLSRSFSPATALLETRIRPQVVCSQNDPRTPFFGASTNITARLLPVGCTAPLATCPANANRQVFLSAGHCFRPVDNNVAQFDVPAQSNADCTLTQPAAASQFTIIPGTVQIDTSGDATGDDWAVFNVMRSGMNNSQTPFQQRGDAWTLFNGAPTTGGASIVGYGTDGANNNFVAPNTAQNFCGTCVPNNANGTSVLNQIAQLAVGTISAVMGTTVVYDIATCGGNSGSPIFTSTQGLVGIHTEALGANGGCSGAGNFTRTNAGTAINNANLQGAITFACTVCDVNNDGVVNNADLQLIQAALGQAAAAGDLRDANRDGIINIQDLRICSLLCTNKNCN